MRILGIETSCDETAAAVVEGKNPPNPLYAKGAVKVLSDIISSQIEIHKKYGGVVPEVAAREHVLNILLVINEALERAGITPHTPLIRGANKKTPLTRGARGIDVIAVTTGPGLITSLQVGVETAKVLSYVWKVPVVAVNHIKGHIYANWLPPIGKIKNQKSKIKNNIKFPALILTVSGGHTMLVLMKGHGKYKVIGETLDDAAGEAFDKAAAMMGIGYPGGPIISAEADNFRMSNVECRINSRKNKSQIENRKSKIVLPRPMINSRDYNFSFSGLKTALLYQIQKDRDWKKHISEYCYEFQQAVIDVLIYKTIKATRDFKIKTIMLSGGVAANVELRKQMAEVIKLQIPNSKFQTPYLKYTTDNAAMIAAAGYFKALRRKFTPWQKLRAESNLEL